MATASQLAVRYDTKAWKWLRFVQRRCSFLTSLDFATCRKTEWNYGGPQGKHQLTTFHKFFKNHHLWKNHTFFFNISVNKYALMLLYGKENIIHFTKCKSHCIIKSLIGEWKWFG
jgi:hypothetical protein